MVRLWGADTPEYNGERPYTMNRTAKGAGWPSPNELCRKLRDPAEHAYRRTLLKRIQNQQKLAYDCLRRARWGEETEVQVMCPKCKQRAWSHSSSKGGKHRWRCVSKTMYEKHQESKHYGSQGRSQHGCGFRFTDTTRTPFDRGSIPLGLVFLALYLPATKQDIVMASLDDTVTAAKLRKMLTTLRRQKHTQLLKGMKRSAARFCGEILVRIKSRPTPKNGSHSRSRAPVNPAGKKIGASDLSRLDATIQSLLDKVNRMELTLQARLTDVQRRLGPRYTLLTAATLPSRKAVSR